MILCQALFDFVLQGDGVIQPPVGDLTGAVAEAADLQWALLQAMSRTRTQSELVVTVKAAW